MYSHLEGGEREYGNRRNGHMSKQVQTSLDFKQDVDSLIKLLQDITGKPVKYFRAPGYSIRKSEAYAFDTLAELDIEIDCSVFPAAHAHGGMPQFPTAAPSIMVTEPKRAALSQRGTLSSPCGGSAFLKIV